MHGCSSIRPSDGIGRCNDSRAQDDADGDGMTNLQEYLAGTNPLDPQSSLKLRAQTTTWPSAIRLHRHCGSRLYASILRQPRFRHLDQAARLSGRPDNWHVNLNDPGAANAPARFYRLVTPIQSASNADSDGDGIPDWWMLQHFGHPTGLASDNSRAQDDTDGDGMSNLQEFLSGTDPRSSKGTQIARA